MALVWSPLLQKPARVYTELYHISDLLPTFINLAGGSIDSSSSSLDGIDIWKSISEDLPSPRKELLIQADTTGGEYALRWHQYKLLLGLFVGKNGQSVQDWYEPPGGIDPALIEGTPGALRCDDVGKNTPCHPNVGPCLFDVISDPCERNNIASDQPEIVKVLIEKLRAYNSTAVPSMFLPTDPRAHPKLHDGLLASWEE